MAFQCGEDIMRLKGGVLNFNDGEQLWCGLHTSRHCRVCGSELYLSEEVKRVLWRGARVSKYP